MTPVEIVRGLEEQGVKIEFSGGKLNMWTPKRATPNLKVVESLTLELQSNAKEVAKFLQVYQEFDRIYNAFIKEPESVVVKKNYARFCIANGFPFYVYIGDDDWQTDIGADGWTEWAKLNEEVKVEDW